MLKDKKTPKVSLSSISVGHLLLGIQPTLRVLCYPVRLFGENENFISKGLLVGDCFWVRDKGRCSLFLPFLGPHLVQKQAGLVTTVFVVYVCICYLDLEGLGFLAVFACFPHPPLHLALRTFFLCNPGFLEP